MPERRGLLEFFCEHDVAANLTMLLMLMAGVWAIHNLNMQVDPDHQVPWIHVDYAWPGASAEDLERLATSPIEAELMNVTRRVSVRSTTREGSGRVTVQIEERADLRIALDEVKQRVAGIRDLPSDLEPIHIEITDMKTGVASILVTGPGSLDELVPLVRDMEFELRELGINDITFEGLPSEEIAIELSSARLRELGLGIDQFAALVAAQSQDVPAGTIGRGRVSRQLRSLERRNDAEGFRRLPILSGDEGPPVLLGEVARVVRRPMEGQVRITHDGQPAIEMYVQRGAGADLLERAELLHSWLEQARPKLPPGVEILITKEEALFLSDLTEIIVRNGASGLALVLLVLYVFLSGRVATWVMLGIPVSFMGAIALYYILGGTSINIVMLFALVMASGIVVDDAVVVGEDAYAQRLNGLEPQAAALRGARRMLAPVLASSLTTLAAFIPLIIIGDTVINVFPLTLVCVIFASLIECFLILPGHLRHAMVAVQPDPSSFRARFDDAFARFREERFRPLLRLSLAHRGSTLALAGVGILFALSLLYSGRIPMNLSVGLLAESVEAHVRFAREASVEEREALLLELERSLEATDDRFEMPGVTSFVTRHNVATFTGERQTGDQYGSVIVELTPPDERDFSNREFASAWRELAPRSSKIEQLQVQALGGRNLGGPDLTLSLSGRHIRPLKEGAEALADTLARYPGVTNVSDDLPYGHDQWILSLTTEGRALGLSVDSIGQQLRTAYEGQRVQISSVGDEQVEVRVMLAEAERRDLASLAAFPIATPSGEFAPLASLARVSSRRGIDVIQHINGRNAVSVHASVDPNVTSPQRVIADIEAGPLQEILERYDLQFGLGGRSAEEAKILETLSLGAVLGLILIYGVLAWVFGSYTWPLAIMITIPLGLTGAFVGHWIMGRPISGMSLLGIFALTGVVVNDSIVLVSFYKVLRADGMRIAEALEEASMQRFRPVLVTSLTTIIGLTPMMFEPSPIASYITPIATSIVWGLSYATLLVVFVIPSLLSLVESLNETRRRTLARLRDGLRDPLHPREREEVSP